MSRELKADYIVVGGGTAGCVIARRILEGLDCSVLLLEAGGADDNPAVHRTDLSSTISLWGSAADWGYLSDEESDLDGRRIPIVQGKLLGGGSSINAMMYVRGNRRDYDRWSALGNENWAYQDVLPYFRKSEDYAGGASAYRGVDGPLQITPLRNPAPVSHAFIHAATELGFAGDEWDYNGERQEQGAFLYQSTRTPDNRRCSTAEAFLRPVLGHPRLTVKTQALVTGITLTGHRATGIEYVKNGKRHRATAKMEVIVSCGALASPKLLMLSGIGSGEHLRANGITPVVDLPGVGRNFQDHLQLGVGYESLEEQPPTELLAEAGLFTYAREAARTGSPDLQLFFGPFLYLHPDYPSDGPGFSFAAVLAQPHSRGTVSLRSGDPDDTLLIQPNYLRAEADREVLIRGIELVRELVATPAFDRFRGRELAPGDSVRSTRELEAYVRKTASTVWHPAGTCKMGLDDEAVVDARLRVHTTEGLRVADASIMPFITCGNTNAPAIMIGEKAADMIVSDAHMPA